MRDIWKPEPAAGADPDRSVVELVGFVVDLGCQLTELFVVGLGVMAAEEQFRAAWQHDTDVRLSTTAVTAVLSGQLGGKRCVHVDR